MAYDLNGLMGMSSGKWSQMAVSNGLVLYQSKDAEIFGTSQFASYFSNIVSLIRRSLTQLYSLLQGIYFLCFQVIVELKGSENGSHRIDVKPT